MSSGDRSRAFAQSSSTSRSRLGLRKLPAKCHRHAALYAKNVVIKFRLVANPRRRGLPVLAPEALCFISTPGDQRGAGDVVDGRDSLRVTSGRVARARFHSLVSHTAGPRTIAAASARAAPMPRSATIVLMRLSPNDRRVARAPHDTGRSLHPRVLVLGKWRHQAIHDLGREQIVFDRGGMAPRGV